MRRAARRWPPLGALLLAGALLGACASSPKGPRVPGGDTTDDTDDTSGGVDPSCVPTGDDEPDPAFVDADCDGIDGDASRALFVAVDGSDEATGTREAPLRTVAAAVVRAKQSVGIEHVYVSGGTFPGTVVLGDGVSIWGGFSFGAGWRRDAGFVTELVGAADASGDVVTLRASGISRRTVVADLKVTSPDATTPGASSIGALVLDSEGLVLERLTIAAGRGAEGSAGVDGEAGASGEDGGKGTGGSCSSGCGTTSGPAGGAAGPSACSPGEQGKQGFAAINTSSTQFSCAGGNNMVGAPGSPGADGDAGMGGVGGAFVDGRWVGGAGTTGGAGTDGEGGKGGLSGATECAFDCGVRRSGSSGGGGGGGGCTGSPGQGGGPGGGSFGAVIVDSPLSALRSSTLLSSHGGEGGRGGGAGPGGERGSGGSGASRTCGGVSVSGKGGDGGAGGAGGAGGGGQGGPTYALWVEGLPPTRDALTLGHGTPGGGGASDGTPGAAGADGEGGDDKLVP